GLKCPVCSFVYGTKWEYNRHLKNKHGLKVVEIDGDPKLEPATETPEEPSTQYLYITEAEEDVQGTQAAVAALQDLRYTSENGDRLDPTAVNILQQIIELGSETHDATAVASVVAMAPGTVTVVKQTNSPTEDWVDFMLVCHVYLPQLTELWCLSCVTLSPIVASVIAVVLLRDSS
ncbi:hypothetical protein A6R68_05659, partial [Neotoma lepida]